MTNTIHPFDQLRDKVKQISESFGSIKFVYLILTRQILLFFNHGDWIKDESLSEAIKNLELKFLNINSISILDHDNAEINILDFGGKFTINSVKRSSGNHALYLISRNHQYSIMIADCGIDPSSGRPGLFINWMGRIVMRSLDIELEDYYVIGKDREDIDKSYEMIKKISEQIKDKLEML